MIRELSRDCGIILSSHILSEVQAVCDRVLVLHQGRMLRSDRFGALGPTALWRVRLRPRGDSGVCSGAERLERIACVEAAIALDKDRFRVILAEGAESADLARQILTAGLDLCELGPEPPDLARVFFDLIGAGGTA